MVPRHTQEGSSPCPSSRAGTSAHEQTRCYCDTSGTARADPAYMESLAIHLGGKNRLYFKYLEHVLCRKSLSTFPGHALKHAGFKDEDLARIRAPIGLDIGAAAPSEIAIAILAEIIAALRRAPANGTGALRSAVWQPATIKCPALAQPLPQSAKKKAAQNAGCAAGGFNPVFTTFF